MQGRIIVLEGADGCGKETQAAFLSQTLTDLGIKNEVISFPSYEDASAIPVNSFLKGELGPAENYSPMEISMLYLFNQSEAIRRLHIEEKIENGTYIIFDRYVYSNLICNGTRINKKKERKDFAGRLLALAFGILSMPEPDIVFYLDASEETIIKNINERNEKDINEKDEILMRKTIKVGRQIAKWCSMFSIKCDMSNKTMRSRESIAEEIGFAVKRYFIVPKMIVNEEELSSTKCESCTNTCEKME